MACVVVAVAVSVVAFVVVRDLYGACFVSFSFLFFFSTMVGVFLQIVERI